MANSYFSNILLDKSPKKINNVSEDILDVLFNINELVRELNSIDFCNPLGYILTKTLPPGGELDNLLKKYGEKVQKFNNKLIKIIEISNEQLSNSDIEEIRISLEEIIPPEQIKDIIPGGDGILNIIQTINDSLVSINISNIDKKLLLQSFSNRLIPLTNPSTITEVLLFNETENLNKKLRNLIKPEKFKEELLIIIRGVNNINKSIFYIENIITIMNKIIKSINSLLKVLKISIRILKKTPTPAKFVTVGITVSTSTKTSKIERDIEFYEKILKNTSIFLDDIIITKIRNIREEITILLIGLNQLYENLKSCDYTKEDILLSEIETSINNLNININTLDNIFPNLTFNNLDNNYKGYKLNIVEEETTNNPTGLTRRRIIVTNNNNIIEYEGTPTYSNRSQLLLKEGQYYIDKKGGINVYDKGNNELTDSEVNLLLSQTGLNFNSLEEAISIEAEVNTILKNQIQNNEEDKTLYNKYIYSNNNEIEKVKKIVSLLYKQNENPVLLRNKLESMKNNLLNQGFLLENILIGIQNALQGNKNIIIQGNNITLN